MTVKKTLEHKICKDCLTDLTKANTNPYNIASSLYICKSCQKNRDNEKYERRKELIREQQRLYDLSLKIKVILAYGGQCNCCPEKIEEFLMMNEIVHQKKGKRKTGGHLYRWLIKNKYPKDNYQVLCYNCHYAKELLGYCPHKFHCLTGVNPKKASLLDGSTSTSDPESLDPKLE